MKNESIRVSDEDHASLQISYKQDSFETASFTLYLRTDHAASLRKIGDELFPDHKAEKILLTAIAAVASAFDYPETAITRQLKAMISTGRFQLGTDEAWIGFPPGRQVPPAPPASSSGPI